ncbi:efflux RND transporter periplasmic adaptor subunit [Nannocystis radixulma]|uniref:Efflux RND transporter periplasmic adaptor subunit n=1 Tax=Nannocystis radixulma TaxID=2995305 RepID=A0ABT5BLX5_9BACT|nr:efflux RND transporter periplasmic adaptor subunit [Nannocystis radixulma]MDC0675166.1 efflux RND transporter periplasmic adaptor subunit [Nannocystis radixulma]
MTGRGWIVLLAAGSLGPCQPGARQREPTAASTSQPAQPGGPPQIVLPPDSPMLQSVRIGEVTARELATDEVVSPAQIEIDPSRLSHVLLPVTGRVREVDVRVGDRVRAGQVLLELDSPEADAAIAHFEQAEADVLAARAGLVKATADRERVHGLFEHDAVARKEVDNVDAAHAQASAQVTRATADRKQARRRLGLLGLAVDERRDTISVKAPISGAVLELHVAPGEFHSDTAQPLMTIADLSAVLVTAEVPENLIRLVALDEVMQIELAAYPGETFSARVVRIADTVDPKTRTIKVQAALPNPDGRLRPEMFGRVRHSRATTATPAVPQSAVLHRGGGDVVLVELGPGRFEVRPVKIGSRSGEWLGLVEGVKVGEKVVTDGGLLLLPSE